MRDCINKWSINVEYIRFEHNRAGIMTKHSYFANMLIQDQDE